MVHVLRLPFRTESPNSSAGHARLTLILMALCCMSMGIAIGAIFRGIAGATPDDNRLRVSTAPATPDTLSAAFARAASQVEPCVAHIKVAESEWSTREGTGSGVIVNSAGFILTNAHVVKGAARIRVKLADASEYDARVVGQDSQTDLAVIRINAERPLAVARMGDSDKLSVGDWVLAIGSPFGLSQTVTAGIISAKDRESEAGATPFQQFLQTDAAINPGNSGGPLVNLAGEVVGINTQIATVNGMYNGIGFALPSSTAVDVYNQLVASGRVRRAFLGVNPQEITPQIARLNKILDGQGVVVRELTTEDSPAAQAGLRSGDVIISINGVKVKTVRELIRGIASLPVSSTASIEYIRAGDKRSANVRLEERREEGESPVDSLSPSPSDQSYPKPLPSRPGSRSSRSDGPSWLGISVRTLTGELAKMKALEGAQGALVVQVDPASVADRNGIAMDDVILDINGHAILTQEDFLKVTRPYKRGDDIVIRVLRQQRGPLRRSWIVSFTMP